MTHVDASKKSVAQARENAALSDMAERPIRWLVDDAAKFAAREVRRGKRYDGIILDPPKFGRGPEGEVWRLEDGLPPLIADCRRLLDADSRFLFLTVYAVRMSSLALAGLLAEHFADLPGTIEHGDLAVREEGRGRPPAADRDLCALDGARPESPAVLWSGRPERHRGDEPARADHPLEPQRAVGIAQVVEQFVEIAAPVAGDGDHADVEVGLLPQRLLAVPVVAHEQQRVAPGGVEPREQQRVGHLAHLVGVGLRQPQHDDARVAQPLETFGQAGRGQAGAARRERRRPVVEVDDHRGLAFGAGQAALAHGGRGAGREQRRIGLLPCRRRGRSA